MVDNDKETHAFRGGYEVPMGPVLPDHCGYQVEPHKQCGKVASEHVKELAGRELDAAIARRVFGWKTFTANNVNAPYFLSPTDQKRLVKQYDMVEVDRGNEENAPHYSTDMVRAMEVVEKLLERYLMVDVGWHQSGQTACRVYTTTKLFAETFAGNAPEAISRAALESVKGEQS